VGTGGLAVEVNIEGVVEIEVLDFTLARTVSSAFADVTVTVEFVEFIKSDAGLAGSGFCPSI